MIEYGVNTLGADAQIFEPVTLGFPSRENLKKAGFKGTTIGNYAIIRSGTIIYCDVEIGDNFSCGHHVLIREKTRIGNRVSIGTASIIEGRVTMGNDVNLQSMVYIPTDTTLGDNVFIGPNTVLTNDRYPPSRRDGLRGPTVSDGASVGANVTILPGVCIGEGSLIAAGAIVTRDVPPYKLAIGLPAKIRDLPDAMRPRH
jgi:acetyltransferase-like isoleucine patch superfamily enzyme